MRLLCLNPALCMRAYRQLKALSERGSIIDLRYLGIGGSLKDLDLSFLNSMEPIFHNSGRMSHFRRTLSPSAYRKTIRELLRDGGYDIVLAYNMPDILGAASTMYSDVPVVFDERDMVTAFQKDLVLENYIPPFLRENRLARYIGMKAFYERLFDLERMALENSSGRTWVSDHTFLLAGRRHNIPQENNLMLYNYGSREDLFPPMERLSASDGEPHVVYEGVLSFGGYRAPLGKVFTGLAKNRVHIHVYGIGPKDVLDRYRSLDKGSGYYHFHEGLPHNELMMEMTRYDWGIVPFDPPEHERDHFDTMLPNKFFDYLVCGLPVLSPLSRSMMDFISREKVGAIYGDIREIPNILYSDPPPIDRDRYLIENHIDGLIKMLQRIVKEGGNKY